MKKVSFTNGMMVLPMLLAMLFLSLGATAQTMRSVQFRMSPEYGTMTVNGNPVAHGTTLEFEVGSTINIHAEPLNDSYLFVNWTNNRGIVFADPTSPNQSVVIPEGTNSIRFVANFTNNVIRYTVNAYVVPEDAGEIPLAQRQIEQGQSTTVVVNPLDNVHYHFEGWSFSSQSVEPTVCYTEDYAISDIQNDMTVYAHFSYLNQLKTVTAAATAGGSATVSYNGNNNQTTIADIPENSDFTLTATPEDGYTFAGWTREGSTRVLSNQATWIHSMPAFSSDSTYTAHFSSNSSYYTISILRDMEGGEPGYTPTGSLLSGRQVTLHAGTYNHFSFVGWYVDYNGDGNYTEDELVSTSADDYQFRIYSNMTILAKYQHNAWTLTLNSNPAGAALFTTTGDNGDGTVNDGANLSVTVAVAEGQDMNYRFDRWSGDNTTDNATISVNGVNRNYSFTANFISTYTLVCGENITVVPGTGVVANANGTYDAGSTFTATAAASLTGMEFGYWIIDGVDHPELTSNVYNVTLDHNTTLAASYIPTHTVTLTSDPLEVSGLVLSINGENVAVGTPVDFREGASVTVSVVDYTTSHFSFDKWTNSGSETQLNNDGEQFYTFEMGNTNRTLVAVFNTQIPTYTVTAQVDNASAGWGVITSSRLVLNEGVAENVAEGTGLDLFAEAAEGYHFDHWDVNGNTYYYNPMNAEGAPGVNVTSDMNITAYFREAGSVNVTIVKHPAGVAGDVTPFVGTRTVSAETPLTLTASVSDPSSNIEFWGWIINGEPRGAMGQTTFTLQEEELAANDNITVHAWFYSPEVEGSFEFLDYSADNKTVIGVKENYRTRVTSITVPLEHEGVVVDAIGANAFSGCISLENLSISPNITSIGNYAFSNCVALTGLDIPANVETLGEYAFNSCSNLQSVTLPDQLTAIPAGLFYNCAALNEVEIPASVNSIGSNAFTGCTSIYDLTIPRNVATIGGSAFSGMTGLRFVTLNEGLTSVAEDAFWRCNGIAQVNFIGTMADWLAIGFENAAANPAAFAHSFFLNSEMVTDLVIPAGTSEVKPYAFFYNSTIETITIPSSVTMIGEQAFYRLSNLNRIVLNNPEATMAHTDAFEGVNKDNVVVEVPCSVLNSITEWNGFTRFVGANMPVLTVTQRPGGNVVIEAPACGATEYTYHLSATAAGGYVFRSWSDGNLNGIRDLTITEDQTIAAIFDRTDDGAKSKFDCDFEDYANQVRWYNVGNGDNKWIVGTATAYEDDHSLYVSNDNGASTSYSLANTAYTYTELNLKSGLYNFSFWYNVNAVVGHDVTVALMPIADNEDDQAYAHLDPYAEQYPVLIDHINGDGVNWDQKSRLVNLENQGWYRLVFFWNIEGENQADDDFSAAIDNIELRKESASNLNNNYHILMNVASANPSMGYAYTWTDDETSMHGVPVTQSYVQNNHQFYFNYNDQIWIHAIPTTNDYRFVRWNDGNTDQHRQLNFLDIYGEPAFFTAYFEPRSNNYTVNVEVSDAAAANNYGVMLNGTSQIAEQEYNVYTLVPTYTVPANDINPVEVTVVLDQPQDSMAFIGWAVNDEIVSHDNPYTFPVTADVNITAMMTKLVDCASQNDPYFGPNTPGSRQPGQYDEFDEVITNVTVSAQQGQVVVGEAAGVEVKLFDVNGRLLETRLEDNQEIHIDVPCSGAYMVKIGNFFTRRVVIIK